MRIHLKGPGHAATLLADLNRCRQMRQYCDVFLQVGSRTFAAHRAVLACAGTYFHTLFTRPPATSSTLFTLEFVSPVNFEKVLTFIYTGEILIDLIDVGVLYELAETLGISELMRTCHATFPDLLASVSAKAGGSSDLHLDSDMIITASEVSAITAASVCSSSCSSLSSSAGPSAAPTPCTASSPLFQARTAKTEPKVQTMASSLDLKMEDVQSHISCEQVAANVQLQQSSLLPSSTLSNQMEGVRPPGPVLQPKTEPDLGDKGVARGSENCVTCSEVISESGAGFLLRSSNAEMSDLSSLSNSSAAPGAENPSSPTGSLQVVSVEGGAMNKDGDDSLLFGEVETGRTQDDRVVLEGNEAMEGTEEEFPPWRQMVGEIIELSDDETYMEDGEDDDDEDDLVCVENGERGKEGNVNQVGRNTLCKACLAPLPADPFAIRQHGESHLTELGLCEVCGASFPDRAASVSHALSHVGVQLFICNMCQLPFCSQNKLLRHHHHSASGYSLPQETLITGSQSLGSELKCAVCTKTFSKRFQSVRDHLLTHVCHQSLTCGVCHLPQLSSCSLLWHTLTHLSVPVFSCPHCACCFVERPLLDRHMAEHAKVAADKEKKLLKLGPHRAEAGAEEIHCLLCSQTFSTSSAFQYHLSLHNTKGLGSGGGGIGVQGWSGKRKADQTPDGTPSSCSSSTALHDTNKLFKITSPGLGLGVPSLFSTVLTNGSSENEGAAEAPGLRGKWYRCRYCGKHFAHSGEFTYHLRIHTGEKPYQCKVCLRFFRGRSTMICHLKTHAGALMYRCTVCGFYFSTLKLVSSHMELHKDHLPPDFSMEQTFMYNDHSKEALRSADA